MPLLNSSPLLSRWWSLCQVYDEQHGGHYIPPPWLPSGGPILPVGPRRDGGGGWERVNNTLYQYNFCVMQSKCPLTKQLLQINPNSLSFTYNLNCSFCFHGDTISWKFTLRQPCKKLYLTTWASITDDHMAVTSLAAQHAYLWGWCWSVSCSEVWDCKEN